MAFAWSNPIGMKEGFWSPSHDAVSQQAQGEIQELDLEEQDGVWVTDYLSFIGLAAALGEQPIHVADAKPASVGKDQKMEVFDTSLTGVEFRQRVQAIIETFAALQDEARCHRPNRVTA